MTTASATTTATAMSYQPPEPQHQQQQQQQNVLLTLDLFACASALVGLLFNGCIILVLVSNRQTRTANNLLLLHLAFVGIVSCFEFLLSAVPYAVRTGVVPLSSSSSVDATINAANDGPYGLCVAHGFVFTALLPIAVWTLCGLNCDRYAAIASPLHYSRLVHRKRLVLFVALTWLLGLSLAVPPLLFSSTPYSRRRDRALCLADFTGSGGAGGGREDGDGDDMTWSSLAAVYPLVYVALSVVVPASLVVFCNVRTLTIARHHRHRIVSAIYEVTVRAQATITHQRNPANYLNKYKGRCAVLTVLQLVGSLLALYGPYCGVMLWELFGGVRCPPVWSAVAVLLVAAVAAPLNGLVYGLKSPVLRITFNNFLRKKLYTSEVRQEIQRRGSVSTRGWTATSLLSHWQHAGPARSTHHGGQMKSRSRSPESVSATAATRTDRPRGRSSTSASAAGLPRCHSESVLIRSAVSVQYRLDVEQSPPKSPSSSSSITPNSDVVVQRLTSSERFDSDSPRQQLLFTTTATSSSTEEKTRLHATTKDQLPLPVTVTVPVPIPVSVPPIANGHCKSPTISLERFLFQARRKKNSSSVVHNHSSSADRKFSLERLRSGHLKRSLRRVFSPPKLLSDRGSI